jgi:hypothetical protein
MSHSGDTVGCGIPSNIQNIRLSTILLENIQTLAVEAAVLLAKMVKDAVSLHQHRMVLRLELILEMILELSL